jgi:hypothetical protein
MADLNLYNEEADYVPEVKVKVIQCPHCLRKIMLSESLDMQAIEEVNKNARA